MDKITVTTTSSNLQWESWQSQWQSPLVAAASEGWWTGIGEIMIILVVYVPWWWNVIVLCAITMIALYIDWLSTLVEMVSKMDLTLWCQESWPGRWSARQSAPDHYDGLLGFIPADQGGVWLISCLFFSSFFSNTLQNHLFFSLKKWTENK